MSTVNFDAAKIKNVAVYKEDDKYYLNVTAMREDEYGVYEINIPKIWLGIGEDLRGVSFDRLCPHVGGVTFEIGELYSMYRGRVFGTKDEALFAERIIETKVHKMTVADIEKKLGYKIEIVSEEKEG